LDRVVRDQAAAREVVREAERLDVLLQPAGDVLPVAPEAVAAQVLAQAREQAPDLGQLVLGGGGGAQRAAVAVAVGILGGDAVEQEDRLLRRVRDVTAGLRDAAKRKAATSDLERWGAGVPGGGP
jgi:hypothetical protein